MSQRTALALEAGEGNAPDEGLQHGGATFDHLLHDLLRHEPDEIPFAALQNARQRGHNSAEGILQGGNEGVPQSRGHCAYFGLPVQGTVQKDLQHLHKGLVHECQEGLPQPPVDDFDERREALFMHSAGYPVSLWAVEHPLDHVAHLGLGEERLAPGHLAGGCHVDCQVRLGALGGVLDAHLPLKPTRVELIARQDDLADRDGPRADQRQQDKLKRVADRVSVQFAQVVPYGTG
mmetsp:Transcript_64346/g.199238  ORF Transcript_64346/g.199238 Transcript_64346/m.199238 type:complete len:234 (-) Transcript_64346:728-1429(-)